MSANPVINSPDAEPEWTRFGPEIRKIVIGRTPSASADGDKPLKIIKLPDDLAVLFPHLTHLYLWGIAGLRALPALPRELECLDLRGCKDLASLPELPAALETLVLDDCTRLKELPTVVENTLPKLSDLSLRGCLHITQQWIQSVLMTAGSLCCFDASQCTQLKEIAEWPVLLERIELNGCAPLSTLPAAWPPKLRRLGLKGAASLAKLPDFPGVLDYVDLALMESLERLPNQIGKPRTLIIFGSGLQLPREFFKGDEQTNVAPEVLAHLGEKHRVLDHEVKVILLGNGRCGKSSLARRLVQGEFDKDEKSTHGIRLWTMALPFQPVEGGEEATARLNIWDFAGQDLYHSTHRLFLQSKAIYLLCGTGHGDGADDERDRSDDDFPEQSEDVRRNLRYWQEQVESLGHSPGMNGPPPILLVRTKTDRDKTEADGRTYWREAAKAGKDLEQLDFSAESGAGLDDLKNWLSKSAAAVLGARGRREFGRRPMAVKAELEKKKAENQKAFEKGEREEKRIPPPCPTISRGEFDALVRNHCQDGAYHEDPGLLLDYLHQSGFLYYNAEHLPDTVILDQRWVIEAIYTFTNRESEWNIREKLKSASGEFTHDEIARRSWKRAGYREEEQKLFLDFMLSCGMCFILMREGETLGGQTVYAAPGFFPQRADQIKRTPELDHGPDTAWASYKLPRVTEPEMQTLLSWLGAHWSRSSEMWRWGAKLSAAASGSRVLLDWVLRKREDYTGTLHVWFDGPKDVEFETFIRDGIAGVLQDPAYASPEGLEACWETTHFRQKKRRPHSAEFDLEDSKLSGQSLQLRVVPERVKGVGVRVTFSFADSDKDYPLVGEIPKALAHLLKAELEPTKRGTVLCYGVSKEEERLSVFGKALAKGDLVLVFWSAKYWHSEDCMWEMMHIYRNSPQSRLLEHRVRVYVIDGQRISDQTPLRHEEWEEFWVNKAEQREEQARKRAWGKFRVSRKRLKRHHAHDWYDFVLDEKSFDEFVTYIMDYRLGIALSYPRSKKAAHAQSAILAKDIIDFLVKPLL